MHRAHSSPIGFDKGTASGFLAATNMGMLHDSTPTFVADRIRPSRGLHGGTWRSNRTRLGLRNMRNVPRDGEAVSTDKSVGVEVSRRLCYISNRHVHDNNFLNNPAPSPSKWRKRRRERRQHTTPHGEENNQILQLAAAAAV